MKSHLSLPHNSVLNPMGNCVLYLIIGDSLERDAPTHAFIYSITQTFNFVKWRPPLNLESLFQVHVGIFSHLHSQCLPVRDA